MSVCTITVHVREHKVVEIYSEPSTMTSFIAHTLWDIEPHILHLTENTHSVKISEKYNLYKYWLTVHLLCMVSKSCVKLARALANTGYLKRIFFF